VVTSHPLEPRVVLLSWLVATGLWPVAWLVPSLAQGVGVTSAGGQWIGLAVPFAGQSWALVNEPTVGFAATHAALWAYWLAPLLAPLVLALLLPLFVPTGRSWLGELTVLHLALASAVLDLGWAPPLGVGDGPAAGLERFWGMGEGTVVGICLLLAAVSVPFTLVRLLSHLWNVPGGPTRRRRLVAVTLHVVVPAGGWCAVTLLSGWRLPVISALAAGGLMVIVLAAAFTFVSHPPIARKRGPEWTAFALAAVVAVIAGGAVAWAGAPLAGMPRAILWGPPGATNNVRRGMERLEIMRLLAPTAPPAPSGRGS
jgi:hypothetical protein